MNLGLSFQDNGTRHHDVVLLFGDERHACDSYCLALDAQLLPEREDAEKVRAVLQRLLGQWLQAAEHLPDGGTIYLPYDFSDQCTGWLTCTRSGDQVCLQRGFALVEGWSLTPSALGDLRRCPRGFEAQGGVLHGSTAEVLEALRKACAAATVASRQPHK